MLYDPKWEVEVKADPFTLDSLIAWLEPMPKRKVYCYMDNGRCLLSQYFIHHGFTRVDVGGFDFRHGVKGTSVVLPDHFNDIAVETPWTFGDALKRARKAIGK